MSLAADTRRAVRANPFLRDALRAGVVNYAAAARYLDVGDQEAVVAALRRFEDDLADYEAPAVGARVTMERGLARTGDPEDALLRVGDVSLGPDGGDLTAVSASGDGVDARALGLVLRRLDSEGVAVAAAGAADGVALVVVLDRDGPDALRCVEDSLG